MGRKRRNNPDPDFIIDLTAKVSRLETDICWIKKKLATLDKRIWYILSGIIITILITIVGALI